MSGSPATSTTYVDACSPDIVMPSMIQDLDNIESFIDGQSQGHMTKLVHNNNNTSPLAAAPQTVATTPRDHFDESTVEPLRELCDELLVRSNALRQENESLVKEISELRAQEHRRASHERGVENVKTSTSSSESLGTQIDRFIGNEDAKRAAQWARTLEGASLLVKVVDSKDGTLHITLSQKSVPSGPATIALRRPVAHAAQTAQALGTAKVSKSATSSITATTAPKAPSQPQQRSVTPTITRNRAPTPARASGAPAERVTAASNSRAASPAITVSATALPAPGIGGLKSRSPTISRNYVANVASSIKPRSTTPVVAARSVTPSVAARKASGPAGGAASQQHHHASSSTTTHTTAAAAATSSTTFQQCGVMLRKGSAGVSRRATGPPTIQKKVTTISASPPRDDGDDSVAIKKEPIAPAATTEDKADSTITDDAAVSVAGIDGPPAPLADAHDNEHDDEQPTTS